MASVAAAPRPFPIDFPGFEITPEDPVGEVGPDDSGRRGADGIGPDLIAAIPDGIETIKSLDRFVPMGHPPLARRRDRSTQRRPARPHAEKKPA